MKMSIPMSYIDEIIHKRELHTLEKDTPWYKIYQACVAKFGTENWTGAKSVIVELDIPDLEAIRNDASFYVFMDYEPSVKVPYRYMRNKVLQKLS